MVSMVDAIVKVKQKSIGSLSLICSGQRVHSQTPAGVDFYLPLPICPSHRRTSAENQRFERYKQWVPT